MKQRYIDLTGRRFHSLVVLHAVPNMNKNNRHKRWLCKCDCGKEKVYDSGKLLEGVVKACGCLKGNYEGFKGTREYCSWQEMKTRCYNPNRVGYNRYGGRGITVCDEWLNSPETFIKDMGQCPKGFTLDRIDNNGNYTKDNCRWASRKEQVRNTSRNRRIDTPQGEMLMVDAAKKSGLSFSTIQYRVNNNWPIDKLFNAPGTSR